MCSTGFPSLLACPKVSLVPPLQEALKAENRGAVAFLDVPLVCAGYEPVESSTRF